MTDIEGISWFVSSTVPSENSQHEIVVVPLEVIMVLEQLFFKLRSDPILLLVWVLVLEDFNALLLEIILKVVLEVSFY